MILNFKKIDKECRSLVRILNKIPGIRTIESCCGHGKFRYEIFFVSKTINNLYAIARCVDIRYGGSSDWRCEVHDTDCYKKPVIFSLNSGDKKGIKTYREARILAKSIRKVLKSGIHKKIFDKRF